jgi:NAD(P)-dependent dehydrogenase (short-subunit alcohol dehydrogenase family)
MKIQGATALVTGANRGLGRHLAQQLRDRGANVYAGARTPGSVGLAGVTPVQLEVADPASVRAAVDGIAAGDVEILADEVSANVRAGLAGGVAAPYPTFA